MALLAGIYFGETTVSAINPFYMQDRSNNATSYTRNGWKGADAAPAPDLSYAYYATAPLPDYPDDRRPYSYYPPSHLPRYDVADYRYVEPAYEPASEPPPPPEPAEVASEDPGYQCIGCDEPAQTEPRPVPADTSTAGRPDDRVNGEPAEATAVGGGVEILS